MAAMKNICLGLLLAILAIFCVVESNPLGNCIRNCAQCKRMYGPYFKGEYCAQTCISKKGNFMPDCVEIGSIAPFLQKYDNNDIDEY